MIRTAILWAGLVTLGLSLGQYIDKGQIDITRLYFYSIGFLFAGLFQAEFFWSENEKRYLKATQHNSQLASEKVKSPSPVPLQLPVTEQNDASEWQCSRKIQEQTVVMAEPFRRDADRKDNNREFKVF